MKNKANSYKGIKRLLCVLFCAVAVFSLLPTAALADSVMALSEPPGYTEPTEYTMKIKWNYDMPYRDDRYLSKLKPSAYIKVIFSDKVTDFTVEDSEVISYINGNSAIMRIRGWVELRPLTIEATVTAKGLPVEAEIHVYSDMGGEYLVGSLDITISCNGEEYTYCSSGHMWANKGETTTRKLYPNITEGKVAVSRTDITAPAENTPVTSDISAWAVAVPGYSVTTGFPVKGENGEIGRIIGGIKELSLVDEDGNAFSMEGISLENNKVTVTSDFYNNGADSASFKVKARVVYYNGNVEYKSDKKYLDIYSDLITVKKETVNTYGDNDEPSIPETEDIDISAKDTEALTEEVSQSATESENIPNVNTADIGIEWFCIAMAASAVIAVCAKRKKA